MDRFAIVAARVGFGILLLAADPASSHEFWLAPQSGTVQPGDDLVADLMIGLLLKGDRYPFLPQNFERFDVKAGGETDAVEGLPGDIPAMTYRVRRPGLHIVVHQTAPFRATYDDWSKFQLYVGEEGFPEIEPRHLARGLPETGFSERYTRYVKALIQAGPARPEDRDLRVGMRFEIVAEANPYAAGLTLLPVRLWWGDAPAADVQIAMLRDNGGVTRQIVRTDGEGRAMVPLGAGRYLLSAVRIDPVENASVVWFSHWAALSFVIE